jgi:hypothetical protein
MSGTGGGEDIVAWPYDPADDPWWWGTTNALGEEGPYDELGPEDYPLCTFASAEVAPDTEWVLDPKTGELMATKLIITVDPDCGCGAV